MLERKFFHLDCHPVIPECEFQCARCIDEIQAQLGAIRGVTEAAMGERAGVSGILVQFDPAAASLDDLLSALRNLPTFYSGRFIPQVIET